MDSEIIAAVMADVNLDLTTPLDVLIGEKHKANNTRPPRIVWVPSTDEFGPATSSDAEPRQILTNFASYDVHIYGASIDFTRLLMHLVISSAYRVCSHFSMRPNSSDWNTEGEAQCQGYKTVLSVTFMIPITDRASTLALIEIATANISETDTGGSVSITVLSGD